MGVMAAATYSHHNHGLSFYVTVDLTSGGTRRAFEHIFVLETIAALAVTGAFYSDFEGAPLLFVDVALNGLEGSASSKLGRVPSRTVTDSTYIESGTFSARELAASPGVDARKLLDRFLISFLEPGDDVFVDLPAGRYTS